MSIFTEPGVPSFLLPGTKVDAWVSSDSSGELKIASTPFCLRRFPSSSSTRRPPSGIPKSRPRRFQRNTNGQNEKNARFRDSHQETGKTQENCCIGALGRVFLRSFFSESQIDIRE